MAFYAASRRIKLFCAVTNSIDLEDEKKYKTPHINLQLFSVATVKTRLLLKNGISVLSFFPRFQRKVENEEIKCNSRCPISWNFSFIHFVFSGDYLVPKYEVTSTPYLSVSIA